MMHRLLRANLVTAALAGLGTAFGSVAAYAGDLTGQPIDWQLGMQRPVTEVGRQINNFHDIVNIIIIAIAVFVLVLMGYVLYRFRESANPTPSKTTHNALLEVAWTALPIVILLIIAIPSFKLLFLQYSYPKPDLTIKATGYQWYWGHEYLDKGGFSFDSAVIRDEDILTKELGDDGFAKKYDALEGNALRAALYADARPLWAKYKMVRLLSTDTSVVVPVNKVVHVLVTAEDVIHNWTVQAFGSKVDAVPGRVTSTWFKAEEKGVYYGQCSELCGKDHAAMPITVRVVDQAVFDAWVVAMKADDTDGAEQILIKASAEDEKRKKLALAKNAN